MITSKLEATCSSAPPYTIGLVGGGSIATSFLRQLVDLVILKDIPGSLHVLQFDPAAVWGLGQSYQDDLDSTVLNSPSSAMSIIESESMHFEDWLQRHSTGQWNIEPCEMPVVNTVPRSVYGRYLNATYQDTLERARSHGIRITRVKSSVVDLIKLPERNVCVETDDGNIYVANEGVLCIGNLPSNLYKQLIGAKGYFHSPYPCKEVTSRVEKYDTVAVIGTGLSAVDAIAALKNNDYQGKIIAVSRHGRLPAVRGIRSTARPLQFFTTQNIARIAKTSRSGYARLEEMVALLKLDIEARTGTTFDLDQVVQKNLGPQAFMEKEIREASAGERHWQSVLYQTNDIIDFAWHLLAPADRTVFSSEYRDLFMAYRVAIPLSNARKILDLLRSSQLTVTSAVQEIRRDGNLFDVRIGKSNTTALTSYFVDKVINATGMTVDVGQADNSLVKSLLRRKIALPSPYGGFLQDFESFALIDGAASGDRRVSLLGSLATGTYFWTTAMSVNARLANRLAHVVVSRIQRHEDRRHASSDASLVY